MNALDLAFVDEMEKIARSSKSDDDGPNQNFFERHPKKILGGAAAGILGGVALHRFLKGKKLPKASPPSSAGGAAKASPKPKPGGGPKTHVLPRRLHRQLDAVRRKVTPKSGRPALETTLPADHDPKLGPLFDELDRTHFNRPGAKVELPKTEQKASKTQVDKFLERYGEKAGKSMAKGKKGGRR